jgi:hypothetical protein
MPEQRSIGYKYRSGEKGTLARDLASLRNSQIFAAPRASLNDPFEGRFDRTALDTQFDLTRTLLKRLKAEAVASSFDNVSTSVQELLGFVDKCGVFSLSFNPLNELTWAHYGGSHQGFCIGYDLEKLVAFEPMHLHCIEVAYENSSPSFRMEELIAGESPLALLRKLLGAKSLPWKYEQEVRILATPHGMHDHDFRAVREIYFGLRCPDETRVAVMETLAGRGVTYKQVASPYPSYILHAEVIPDTFAAAPAYLSRVAPIDDRAILPDYLKPELRQYAAYLVKAAEIVRREPYCERIQLVEFSSFKGTPEAPVIFVQYVRAPNKYVNHYLTLGQIDEQYGKLGHPCGDV